MSRPQVLVLTKTAALGGAERLLMNALPHLDRRRFDYRFAVLERNGPLAAACSASGVPLEPLPHSGALDPRNALALRRRLRRERIDLLHAHLPLTGALARVAARGLSTRVVYTEHSVQEMYRRPSRALNAATYGWQTAVVAVSQRVGESAAAHIGERARRRSRVIPNGLDFDALDRQASAGLAAPLPRSAAGGFRLLVPASLARIKGQDVLIDALARLQARRRAHYELWFAGDGPERRRLEVRVQRARLSRVHFLGARGDIFALMRSADAVALPSRFEGHPLALLEAMALGRPVVAASVGGVPEIVEDEVTGLLFPSEDADALAAELERLARDPGLRARLGAAARAHVREHFDIRNHVAAVEALYRRCLGERD